MFKIIRKSTFENMQNKIVSRDLERIDLFAKQEILWDMYLSIVSEADMTIKLMREITERYVVSLLREKRESPKFDHMVEERMKIIIEARAGVNENGAELKRLWIQRQLDKAGL